MNYQEILKRAELRKQELIAAEAAKRTDIERHPKNVPELEAAVKEAHGLGVKMTIHLASFVYTFEGSSGLDLYNKNVDVVLVGVEEGGAVIRGLGNYALWLNGKDCRVEMLNVAIECPKGYGIRICNRACAKLHNCDVRGCGKNGVYVYDGAGGIDSSNIHSNEWYGVYIEGRDSTFAVTSNRIHGNKEGDEVGFNDEGKRSKCTIAGNSAGTAPTVTSAASLVLVPTSAPASPPIAPPSFSAEYKRIALSQVESAPAPAENLVYETDSDSERW